MAAIATLKRGIRFRDLVLFYVISGLSVRWTAAAAAAGPSILVIWVAALVGFFIPLAACVMEMSSRHPDEGGLYVWTREAFGHDSGFMAAWACWMSNLPYFSGVLYFGAASALFAMGERGRALSSNSTYYLAFSVAWLAVITLLNIRGVNAGKWVNNIGSLGSLLPLVILLLLAAGSYARFGPAVHFSATALIPHWSINNAIFWSSVFFAFSGMEAGSAMGDEIENPRRVVPWAILVGGSIMTFGYIGGTAALLVALPSNAVGGPDGFVNGIHALTSRLGLGWLLAPVALLVALNSVGNAAAYLSSFSRLPFVAGIDHYLPAPFAWVHSRFRTPWVAILSYGLAGIVVALLGQAGTTVRGAYDVLVSMGIICYFLPYLFLFASMIRLQREPAGPEVRCVPGGKPVAIALAVTGLISTTFTIILSVFPAEDDPHKVMAVVKVVGGTAVMIGLGFVLLLIARYKSRKLAEQPAQLT
jgi:glutamate:GABA antiporter